MEECSVLIETTKSAEDKTSRWFDLPIDYELFRDLLGVEADSKDYQITDMKLPFAGDIVRTTSVRRLNKLYFAYTDLSPEVQQAYKELIPYCGGVEDLLQKSEEFLFYPECHNIMDVARYRLEHNIEFFCLSEKERNILIWKPTPMNWKKRTLCSLQQWYVQTTSNLHRWFSTSERAGLCITW